MFHTLRQAGCSPCGHALVLSFLLIVTGFCLASPARARPTSDIRGAMVKIYQVASRPDYDSPWNRHGPRASSGSGCILSGRRILTNAHVVSDQTFLQVQRHGQAKKYTAHVVAVAHDADLALLSVTDEAFFAGVTPLALGTLPDVQDEVVVYGFPHGGRALSTTKGVVSRIEHRAYAHSTRRLLAAQLDAAINPGNSGGPVLFEDRIVGVAMQSLVGADNIGYMVPAPIIKHVLTDLQDGAYDGFPELGIRTQPLENASLKRLLAGRSDVSGLHITHIVPGAAADGHLVAGDVLTSVAGHPIADDGTVEFRPGARTSYAYYTQQHQLGDVLTVGFLRAGRPQTLEIRLSGAAGAHDLVPGYRYDVRPSYYIYGGLVLCPLTLDYLRTWGKDWYDNAPTHLVHDYVRGRATRRGEEVVIIMKVLAADMSTGYSDLVDQRIVAVNGQTITNLLELVALVEQPTGDAYTVFTTQDQERIVFDREQVKRETRQLLETYDIPRDRSEDLLPPHLEVSQLP